MNNQGIWASIILGSVFVFAYVGMGFPTATSSECINCHTDADKLQALTKNLPKEEKSAETSGAG